MAVVYRAQICPSCAGREWEESNRKNFIRCTHCGNEIERQEQYDGLFTVKNVVRQSLLDSANRRLESAGRNLLECEKIDQRYVGTLIAKLTYDLIRLITPGACEPRDLKNVRGQVRRTYDQLTAGDKAISDDEEILYEFLEEPDIYATLVFVFDTLNDTERRDRVLKLIDVKEVYSKSANLNLLSFALRNGNTDLADQVIENAENLDPKIALKEVLDRYPDIPAKGDRAAALLVTGEIGYEDRGLVEDYLSGSADSAPTKSKVSVAALDRGLMLRSDLLIEHVVGKADPETVKNSLTALCKTRLSDEDVAGILDYSYRCGDVQCAFIAMDCLKSSGQFVMIPPKMLILMLSGSAFDAKSKVELIERSLEFKIDRKALEAVLSYYLCENTDAAADRKEIIACLLSHVSDIPTSTVEKYVLYCTTDGDDKPSIVSSLFEKDLNVSFFNDLLSKYLKNGSDPSPVKEKISDILTQKGLKIDPDSLIDYICNSQDEPQVKVGFVKKSVANGSQLRADAASAYLERVPADRFSSELFSAIVVPSSYFSQAAVGNYVLGIKGGDAGRAANVKIVIDRASFEVTKAIFPITHLGNRISCNLAQAYVLSSRDPVQVALEIADHMIGNKRIKLNTEISVSGSSMKFKKYIAANQNALSETAASICGRYRL